MRIRVATDDDFDAVAALLAELGRPEVGEGARAACRQVYEWQVADRDACQLVAEERGEVVGVCTVHFRPRLNHPTPEAWIPDLIVTETARRRGIARRLLAEAERRAAERGCHALTLESAYHREPAHALYLAAGMHDVGKSFWKRVGGSAGG